MEGQPPHSAVFQTDRLSEISPTHSSTSMRNLAARKWPPIWTQA